MFDELFFNGSQTERALIDLKALEKLKRHLSQSLGNWHRKILYHQIQKLIARLKRRYEILVQRFHALLVSRKESWDHFKRLENSRWQYHEEIRTRRYKSNVWELFATSLPSEAQYKSIAKSLNEEFDAHYHRVYASLKQRFEQEQLAFYYKELRQKELLLKLHTAYQAGDTANIAKLEDDYRLVFDKQQIDSSQIAHHVAQRAPAINLRAQPGYDEAQLRQKAHAQISQAAAVIAQIALLGAIKNRSNNTHELFVFKDIHQVSKQKNIPPVLEGVSKQQKLFFSQKLNALHSRINNISVTQRKIAPIIFTQPQVTRLISKKKKELLPKFRH